MKAFALAALMVALISQPVLAQPGAAPPPSQKPAVALSGKVVQTMDGGGYTYILLDQKGKKQWVAVPAMKVTPGSKITLQPGQEMKNFKSPKLNKSFESIIFSAGVPGKEDAAKDAIRKNHASAVKGHGKPEIPAAKKKVKVTKATGAGAYSVAEVHAKAAELIGKQVTVRGKVVKVTPKIMKRTWIHIADGTGKAGTDDLLVTSQQTPKADEVITATGTVRKDADFGAGYRYSVVVENATISSK